MAFDLTGETGNIGNRRQNGFQRLPLRVQQPPQCVALRQAFQPGSSLMHAFRFSWRQRAFPHPLLER